jgi:hypothetical protein
VKLYGSGKVWLWGEVLKLYREKEGELIFVMLMLEMVRGGLMWGFERKIDGKG